MISIIISSTFLHFINTVFYFVILFAVLYFTVKVDLS
ncbi:Uncharacterised protein [Myroides odoratus]|nr:hypothetical protein Myrod_3442 [Myroides odoratus DSM 2801]EKB05858.1 hypothetical protein HMPREF9716_02651 [Myroides odoratus CIP 103059]STZ31584.1 Uncharacterised protein [Myroides odoratus]